MGIQVLIFDFGSQYTLLIFHKLLYKLKVNVELIDFYSFKNTETVLKDNYPDLKAIILSGSPRSINNISTS